MRKNKNHLNHLKLLIKRRNLDHKLTKDKGLSIKYLSYYYIYIDMKILYWKLNTFYVLRY